MARSPFAGSTDYSHQSIEEILLDLKDWQKSLTEVLEFLTSSKTSLQKSGYWGNQFVSSIGWVFDRSVKFFEMSRSEIIEITDGILSEVEPNHITRLKSLAKTADNLNRDLRQAWNSDFEDGDYGEPNYDVVSRMYSETGDMAADLLDLSNVSARLEDFIGKKNPSLANFDLDLIGSALWVLEDHGQQTQGTAFMLSGVGLITCQHVLRPNMYAFKWGDPAKKYEITVLRQNKVIDLAILSIDAPLSGELHSGTADNVKQMDAIAVAGHPNYRTGDTFVIHPGMISGHRPVSGITRLLVNVPIVAGNSGGPVVNRNNQVIGVAVTGADRMENAYDTENHGVIPIDALQYLQRD